MLTNDKFRYTHINQSKPSANHPELILTSVVYSAAISWRTLDTLLVVPVIANTETERVRLEDERVEDPPPFKTFVVLSDFETLLNFF